MVPRQAASRVLASNRISMPTYLTIGLLTLFSLLHFSFLSFSLSFSYFSSLFSLFFSNRVSEGLRVCLRKNTCSMAVCTGKELRLGKWKLYNWDNGQRGREKGRKDVQDRVHQSRLNRNLETERRSKLMLIYYKLP